VNAIASRVNAWLDARGPALGSVRAVAGAVEAAAGTAAAEESFTDETIFDAALRDAAGGASSGTHRCSDGGGLTMRASWRPPGVPDPRCFVRNPTGVSALAREFAERDDCLGASPHCCGCARARRPRAR